MTVFNHLFALAAAFVCARLLRVSYNDPQYLYAYIGLTDVRACIVLDYPL
jgi:hypothetical protein